MREGMFVCAIIKATSRGQQIGFTPSPLAPVMTPFIPKEVISCAI